MYREPSHPDAKDPISHRNKINVSFQMLNHLLLVAWSDRYFQPVAEISSAIEYKHKRKTTSEI